MSSVPPDLPADVQEAARVARRLGELDKRTVREEAELNQARLKIAYYACRRERVPLDWDNLAFILGEHAAAIRPAYEQAHATRRADNAASPAQPAADDADAFWGTGTRPAPPPPRR